MVIRSLASASRPIIRCGGHSSSWGGFELPILILFVLFDKKGACGSSTSQIQRPPGFAGKGICPDAGSGREDSDGGIDLRPKWIVGVVSIACVALTVAFGAVPAAAMTRGSGDFWTWDVSMGVVGVNATGTITYAFAGEDTLTINGVSYPVNVMKITGGVSGSLPLLGFQASAALGGFVYEAKDGMSLVKNDLFMWTNLTIGTGSFQIVSRSETELATTYSPPLMSSFKPSSTGPGDSWSETIQVTSVTTTWSNGTLQGSPETSTDTVTFNFVVAGSKESVTTAAGTFDCMKITATGGGETTVYWWSSKAQNFVKEESYSQGDTQPFSTMTLKEYKSTNPTSVVLFVAVGGGVLVLALIVLALVMLMKRRPGAPTPIQPGTTSPPPPSPPPYRATEGGPGGLSG